LAAVLTKKAAAGACVHHLDPEPASVPVARRLACSAAAPYLDNEQFKNFQLAVTEIVSNAVRHGGAGGGQIRVAVTPKDGYICVQVTDWGPGLVPRPGAFESDDDGGFGLFIVERLTRRWGVTREDNKTRVWFELDFASASRLAA
jgi:anti-sigma regulatory factor (Ser/Thr protein kinase)